MHVIKSSVNSSVEILVELFHKILRDFMDDYKKKDIKDLRDLK